MKFEVWTKYLHRDIEKPPQMALCKIVFVISMRRKLKTLLKKCDFQNITTKCSMWQIYPFTFHLWSQFDPENWLCWFNIEFQWNHILTIHVLGQEKKSPELWIKFLPAWKVMYFICAEYHIILVSFSINVIDWILINHLVY